MQKPLIHCISGGRPLNRLISKVFDDTKILNISKKGFTLAEVLITLGIIGVIAAMVMPALLQEHERKVTVSKMKKMYSTLSQAYTMNKALDDIGLVQSTSSDTNAAKQVAAIFVPYLKIAKDCGTTQTGCMFNGTYKFLSGSNMGKYEYGGSYVAYRVILNDGASIWFRRTNEPEKPATVFYDINGPKEPNTWGKDLFLFLVVNDKVVPAGVDDVPSFKFSSTCKPTGSGYGCAIWVLTEENLEYQKCSGLQLNGTKKKCN